MTASSYADAVLQYCARNLDLPDQPNSRFSSISTILRVVPGISVPEGVDSGHRTMGTDAGDGHFPLRPDYGVQGAQKNVQLWANYFVMDLQEPNLVLNLYDMNFKPLPPKGAPPPVKELTIPEGKKLMQVVRCALKTSTFKGIESSIATDFSQTLISSKKLGADQLTTGEFKFWAENELADGVPKPQTMATRFQMTLKERKTLLISDLKDYLAFSGGEEEMTYETILPIVQALDIILGHCRKLSLKNATPKHGKIFPLEPTDPEKFKLEGPPGTPGYLQGVRGFFASVRATTDRTLVNCNACCGAFYKPGPLVTLFTMFLGKEDSQDQRKKLEKAIRGLRVELTHLKDKNGQPIPSFRTIFGLARTFGGPKEVDFYHEVDKVHYTVAEYWTNQKYKPIQNLAYPVLNVGNKGHPTYVPPDVCTIVSGQMAKRMLDSTQTGDMIKGAIRDPEATRNSINNGAFKALDLEHNSTLGSFGLSLKPGMVDVKGRVLKQPSIIYKTGSEHVKVDNKARWNLTGKTVFQGGQLKLWGMLRITRPAQDPRRHETSFNTASTNFLSILRNTLGAENVAKPFKKWQQAIDYEDEAGLKEVFNHCKEQSIDFLIIVLPDRYAGTYKQIKRLGDIEFGINTVCVLGEVKKFYGQGMNPGYFANIALKINLKLEGINHILGNEESLYNTTMVIGIDVTHPSPGPTKKTAPSVAAMVASVDSKLAQWPVDLRINTSGKEMVDLLGPMLTTRLEEWKKKHGMSLPKNLLIYRDGVSEGQYKSVLAEELGNIRNTCEIMYGEGKIPRITLIIVGKRHHTRFFRRTGQANCANPECGTVVDTGVTEARNWDFFLQSHHALIGTARPAHYFVLLNEIFTSEFLGQNVNISDYLQKLTFDMCFLFGRSTGPVSIPPPVYYADLACERSRCYGDFDDDISDTSSIIGEDRGNSQGSRSETQLPFRAHGSGSHTSNRPGPSKQGPGSTAPGKKEDASKKQLRPTEGKISDLMANLSKKEKAKLFEERVAAKQKAPGGGSSKAEEKKPEANPQAKIAQGKTKEEKASSKVEREQPKAEGKKPERSVGGQNPAHTETPKSKEKAMIEINPALKDKMFYI